MTIPPSYLDIGMGGHFERFYCFALMHVRSLLPSFMPFHAIPNVTTAQLGSRGAIQLTDAMLIEPKRGLLV